jgi:hypothetical protein
MGKIMLSAPSFLIWLISTLLAALVLVMIYGGVSVPVVSPIVAGHTFETLLIAYVLLWLGTIVSGM